MKRLVVCCDGTWNKPGQTDNGVVTETNVLKISQLVCTAAGDVLQLTHYHPGVGNSRNFLRHLLGGIDGEGLDHNIIEAYRFLVLNYQPGDEIYLFGFSRGAYTARSLAGFIVNCGILKKEHAGRICEAFSLYRERGDDSAPHSQRANDFRAKYSHPPAIHFIGVWDTVGALGIPIQPFMWIDRDKYKFHDTELSSCVRFAYHALATDEHRKIFNATLWQLSKNGEKARKENKNSQTIEQVWFPGSHGNVGGGYVDTGLSDNTLEWMIEKAERAGLVFNRLFTNIKPDIINGVLRNSKSFGWSLLQGFLPFYRKIFLQDLTFIDQHITPGSYLRPNYDPPNRPPQVPLVHRLNVNEQVEIEVHSAQPYSFNLLEVDNGESYQFECDRQQRWNDAWVSSSAKGYFNPLAVLWGLRVKNASCFCLCGSYECDDDAKNTFAIGFGCRKDVDRKAFIAFFANDSTGFYFNNHGSVKLKITRIT
jgi:hypothetical protein